MEIISKARIASRYCEFEEHWFFTVSALVDTGIVQKRELLTPWLPYAYSGSYLGKFDFNGCLEHKKELEERFCNLKPDVLLKEVNKFLFEIG